MIANARRTQVTGVGIVHAADAVPVALAEAVPGASADAVPVTPADAVPVALAEAVPAPALPASAHGLRLVGDVDAGLCVDGVCLVPTPGA